MGTSPTAASARGKSASPKPSNNKPPRQDPPSDVKTEPVGKLEGSSNAEVAKPLAPPPRPGQPQQAPGGNDTPDFFAPQVGGGSLSLEPNPFEQSFGGGGGPETPGGTKLPSVAALTSPSSLLPGSNATPFNWGGGSLRTGPLSPAMLSGPANDYFSDAHHLRGGFPTPNESSLRSGLTPGGSGSMFPAPSPSSQAIFAQLASGGATPNTIDFHRTALSAAAKREHSSSSSPQQPQQQPATSSSQPQESSSTTSVVKSEAKPATGPLDPHDNDAANGLYMLAQGAQGRNGAQNSSHFPTAPAPAPAPAPVAASAPGTVHAHPAHHPSSLATQCQEIMAHHSNNHVASIDSGRAASENSNISEEGTKAKPSTRGRAKKSSVSSNGRRKADELPAKLPPSKKGKGNNGMMNGGLGSSDEEEEDDDDDDLKTKIEDGGSKSKMTDEEKRKNFLERNRVAALKCRQRKKQWLANLQNKVELFSTENDALSNQITQLKEEVVNLKALLLAHKDCSVTQQHGAYMSQMEPYNTQMNPYGMAGPMSNSQVMPGQGAQRRYP